MKQQSADKQPGFLARLVRTPVTHLVRGNVSGRLSARSQATQAGLPAELMALVERTSRGTRLSRHKQRELAETLIAHMIDTLAAGVSIEQATVRFGDPAVAARLLRGAYHAHRSRSQRLMHRLIQTGLLSIVALLLGATALTVRYVSGRPAITQDYLAQIEQPARLRPSQDLAWPLYRAALLELEAFPDRNSDLSEQAFVHAWPQIASYLRRNRPAFELARQAAAKPRFGFVYGDPEDAVWLQKLHDGLHPLDTQAGPLYTLPAPQLDDLALLRRLLLADSRRALAAQEASVFCSNIQTLLGMAEHLREGAPSAMTELRAFACFGTSLQLMGFLLDEHSTLLSKAELLDLAHRIAAYSGGGTLRARLQGEHLLFEDLLQRTCTNDGADDGRLTAEGYRLWRQLGDKLPEDPAERLSPWGLMREPLGGTALSLMTASRRDLSDMAERLVLRFQSERSGPLWQWEASTAEEQIEKLLNSPHNRIRYWPVLHLFPSFQNLALRGEVLTQQRDAMLTVIALELHRRREGHYPEMLEQLTPSPLPAVPLDRFTGKPLCYRLIDGQPLVYSTGMDRDDDGGRPHRMGNDLAERWEPWKKVSAPPRLLNDGFGGQMLMGPKFDWDWILWPQPIAAPQARRGGAVSLGGS